ncbi:hypothetical protein [Corynebacterium matruchotii]|uniref:hypothetical protein n=1 Tax=Corynebacterium matruchotii TaxID=43768 RepID=UPI00287FFC33|nr:hypothetical protein [Corynebacterium matruchotii]
MAPTTMTFKPTVPVRLTLIIPGVAIIAALVAYFHWTPPTIIAALVALALIGWAAWGCTVRITVDDTTVSLVAPLWSREIPLDSIESVQVIPDDGRNRGWINWIVTKSRAGVRINAGGTAAVVITARAETYTIVCPTPEQARLCAQLFDA